VSAIENFEASVNKNSRTSRKPGKLAILLLRKLNGSKPTWRRFRLRFQVRSLDIAMRIDPQGSDFCTLT
jgi:hypothetical protein